MSLEEFSREVGVGRGSRPHPWLLGVRRTASKEEGRLLLPSLPHAFLTLPLWVAGSAGLSVRGIGRLLPGEELSS